MDLRLILLIMGCSLWCMVESKRCKQYTGKDVDDEFDKHFKKSEKELEKLEKQMTKKNKISTKVKNKEERKALFLKEKDRVNKANQGNPKFCQVLNKFSFMTPEEIQTAFTGGQEPEKKERKPDSGKPDRELADKPRDNKRDREENVVEDGQKRFKRQLPQSVDHSASTGPVEQQFCGTCWAFAGVHTTIGVLKIKLGIENLDYSEQQIADCGAGRTDSCKGGTSTTVFEYYLRNRALLNKHYPYAGEHQECAYTTPEFPETHVVGYTYTHEPDLTEMMTVVAEHPVAITMMVDFGGFEAYGPFEDGTFGVWSTDETCEDVNHVMVAVGYGTDPEYGDYWLVKNSWGDDWGDKGYIKVARGSNVCNVESSFAFPVVSKCPAQHWELKAKTGDRDYADTYDGYVYVVFHGSEGDSSQLLADDEQTDTFEVKGRVDTVTFGSERVGAIKSIDVGTLSAGWWYLEWLELKDRTNGDIYKFVLNAWLSTSDIAEYTLQAVESTTDWELVVKTGDLADASAGDDEVYFKIKGSKATTRSIFPAGIDNFQQGALDTFHFRTEDVGSLTEVEVGTTWYWYYMEYATLTDLGTGTVYTFVLNDWVDAKGGGVPAYTLGPVPGPVKKWTVQTQTSDTLNAGTYDYETIYIIIHGSDHVSTKVNLDNDVDNFLQGQLDTFTIHTAQLGSLVQIELLTETSNGWYPDWVKLTDTDSGEEYTFVVDQWVDAPETPSVIIAV